MTRQLGGDFAFAAPQRRLRVGEEWYRVDLVFFHRKLRSLVVIDLKLGRFTHADAGQMHVYLNYAKEHWVSEGENPPAGVILCAQKDEAVAHYALEGLANKVLAREYRTVVEAIAEYLQVHAGLHFSLGLVELPIYLLPNGDRLVVPRVLARTVLVTRNVVAVPEGYALELTGEEEE
jgi:hypothetical protein